MRGGLRYIPVHPREWREHYRKLVEVQPLAEAEFLRRVGHDKAWLEDRLREDQPEKDRRRYAEGLRMCVEANPEYTLEEIAAILHVDAEWLQKEIKHSEQ